MNLNKLVALMTSFVMLGTFSIAEYTVSAVTNIDVDVNENEVAIIKGDLNKDNNIDILDYICLKNYYIAKDVYDSKYDLNADSKVDSIDILFMKKYLLGYDIVFIDNMDDVGESEDVIIDYSDIENSVAGANNFTKTVEDKVTVQGVTEVKNVVLVRGYYYSNVDTTEKPIGVTFDNGTWLVEDLPLEIGINNLVITITDIDGNTEVIKQTVERLSESIELDNVKVFGAETEEDLADIAAIKDGVLFLYYTKDDSSEEFNKSITNMVILKDTPLYKAIVDGRIEVGDIISIDRCEYYPLGYNKKLLGVEDYVGQDGNTTITNYEDYALLTLSDISLYDIYDFSEDLCIDFDIDDLDLTDTSNMEFIDFTRGSESVQELKEILGFVDEEDENNSEVAESSYGLNSSSSLSQGILSRGFNLVSEYNYEDFYVDAAGGYHYPTSLSDLTISNDITTTGNINLFNIFNDSNINFSGFYGLSLRPNAWKYRELLASGDTSTWTDWIIYDEDGDLYTQEAQLRMNPTLGLNVNNIGFGVSSAGGEVAEVYSSLEGSVGLDVPFTFNFKGRLRDMLNKVCYEGGKAKDNVLYIDNETHILDNLIYVYGIDMSNEIPVFGVVYPLVSHELNMWAIDVTQMETTASKYSEKILAPSIVEPCLVGLFSVDVEGNASVTWTIDFSLLGDTGICYDTVTEGKEGRFGSQAATQSYLESIGYRCKEDGVYLKDADSSAKLSTDLVGEIDASVGPRVSGGLELFGVEVARLYGDMIVNFEGSTGVSFTADSKEGISGDFNCSMNGSGTFSTGVQFGFNIFTSYNDAPLIHLNTDLKLGEKELFSFTTTDTGVATLQGTIYGNVPDDTSIEQTILSEGNSKIPLSNVFLKLYGVDNDGKRTLISQTVTSSLGKYAFTNIPVTSDSMFKLKYELEISSPDSTKYMSMSDEIDFEFGVNNIYPDVTKDYVLESVVQEDSEDGHNDNNSDSDNILSVSTGFTYRVIPGTNNIAITGYSGARVNQLVFPSSIDGYTVTQIDPHAICIYCMTPVNLCEKDLVSITLPNTIEYISDYAFRGCKVLEEVNIDSDNLIYIGEDAFGECDALKCINITTRAQNLVINKWAFYENSNLREINVTLDNSKNKYIGTLGLFEEISTYCPLLEKVTLTAYNANIHLKGEVFSGNASEKLNSICMKSDRDITLDDDCIKNCSSLETLVINCANSDEVKSNVEDYIANCPNLDLGNLVIS